MKNTKKRKTLKILPIIFGVVGFLVIGATIAYNQNTAFFNNLFHLDDASRVEFIEDFTPESDWTPCEEIPKTAIAKNDKGVMVNLRLKYDEYWLSKEGEDMPLQKYGENIAIINFQNQTDWELKSDGWYYYKHQLAPGDESNSLFKSVTMNCGMNMSKELKYCENSDGTDCDKDISEYSEADYHIFIRMQTYQGEPPADQYSVSIDPNGGTFNDSSEVYTATVDKGTVIDLSDIERSGFNFVDWTLNDSESYTDSSITINGDTTLVANWEQAGPIVARIERTQKLYPSIMAAHEEAIANDIITLLVDTEEVVTNEKTVTLDLGAHTVTGSLTNTAVGNLTLINGEINNPNGAAATNNGTLTIGIDDYTSQGADIDDEYIRLVGTTTGLKQNGVFNFYDGYLEGTVGLDTGYDDSPFYRNTFDDVEVHYFPTIRVDDQTDIQHVTLTNGDRAVSKTTVGGDVYYYNLQDNINDSARTGYTMYAIRDFSATYNLSVPANEDVTLDLAGFTVTPMDQFTVDGSLTITDTGNEPGLLFLTDTMTVNGDLTIDGAAISSETTVNTLDVYGNLTMTNAAEVRMKSNNYHVVNIEEGSTLDIDNSSTITGYVENLSANFSWTSGNISGVLHNNTQTAMTISGGHIENYGSNASVQGLVTIANGADISGRCNGVSGNITMNGGTVSLTNVEGDCVAVTAQNPSVINGGIITISSTGKATGVSGAKGVVVNDGTITAQSSRGYSVGVSVDKVNGGTISATASYQDKTAIGVSSIRYDERYRTEVNGGTITATASNSAGAIGIYRPALVKGDTSVTATSASGFSHGIEQATTIEGNVTVSANSTSGTAEALEKPGTVNAGTFTASSTSGLAYGMHSDTRSYVYGGTITGSTYGILAETTGTNTVILGENDGSIDTESPEITGGSYALSGNSFSFFDGILKGTAAAYQEGSITAIPDGASYHKEIIDGKENCWLEEAPKIYEVDGVGYGSLEEAYDAITGNSGTVKLIMDATSVAVLPGSPSDKNVTFDLNGHVFTTTQPIINNGTMTITDSSQGKTGKIVDDSSSYAIRNYGTMTVDDITVEATYGSIYHYSPSTLTINGGSYSGSSSSAIYINKNGNGTHRYVIDNATITSTGSEKPAVTCAVSAGELTISGTTSITTDLSSGIAIGFRNDNCATTIKDSVSIYAHTSSNESAYGVWTQGGSILIKDNASIDAYGEGTSSTNLVIGGIYNYDATITPSDITIQGGTVTARAGEISYNGRTDVYGIRAKGNITVSGGTINSNSYIGASYGVYTEAGGNNQTFNMTAGTINATAYTGTPRGVYITNRKNLVNTISGGTITAAKSYISPYFPDTSDTSGVQLYGEGNIIKITGGTISADMYGILTQYSTAILGENGTGDIPSIVSPEIVGGKYAVYNKDTTGAKVEFYDGILKGGTNAYYEGTITAIPDGYSYHIETIDGKENCWLEASSEFLEVNGSQFNNFDDAYSAITGNSGTIYLIKDADIDAVIPASPAGKTVTIDLNGHELIYSQPLINSSTMIITDSSVGQTGVLNNTSDSAAAIQNNGNLTLSSGSIQSVFTTIIGDYGTSFTMDGGSIKSASTAIQQNGDSDASQGTITINHGTISAVAPASTWKNAYAITGSYYDLSVNNDSSISAINNHTSDYGSYAIVGSAGSNITVNDTASITVEAKNASAYAIRTGFGGSITVNDNVTISVENAGGTRTEAGGLYGSTTINGGSITVEGTNGKIYGAEGSKTINGGTITVSGTYGNAYGAYGHTIINDGTITVSTTGGQAEGIYTYSNAPESEVHGGTITSTTTSGTSYGVMTTKNLTIDGGTISGDTYGVYISDQNTTVTIGDDTNAVSQADPSISGGQYGVYGGTYHFYDGILKGTVNPYQTDSITDLANGYEIQKGTDSNYRTAILVAKSDVARIGQTNYQSLQEAFDAAGENDLVEQLRDYSFVMPITIATGKKFTFDTHGYDIDGDNTITNNGEVAIINSDNATEQSNFSYDGTNYLINNGAGATLTIDDINFNPVSSAIQNNGTLQMDNVEIHASSKAIVNNSVINESTYITVDCSTREYGIQTMSNSSLALKNFQGNNTFYGYQSTLSIDTANITTEFPNGATVFNIGYSTTTLKDVQLTARAIHDGNLSTLYPTIMNHFNGDLSITDSNIKMMPVGATTVGVVYLSNNNGNVVIDNSNFSHDMSENTASSTRSYTLIDNSNGTGSVLIKSGSMSAYSTMSGNFGIKNGNGTITLGEPEDPGSDDYGKETAHVSTSIPNIDASSGTSSTGIYTNTNGKIYFYDGIVKAKTTTLNRAPNGAEYMYEPCNYSDGSGGYYAILNWMRDGQSVCSF